MAQLGSTLRPLAIAIVGAGPSGFYAAEALLKAPDLSLRIDLFDRLPTPYGLVRGGVSPDHQKIKSVVRHYDQIARDPRLRLFGDVHVGRGVGAGEIAARYDAVIYANGCESDRHLGIPGEELAGSCSATEFVGWYNGHPDHRDRTFDLTHPAAAVIGVGNVAIDVARLLVRRVDELAATDTPDYALDALRRSAVRTVWLLGRRGPAEAAYSKPEIEELGALHGCDLVIDPDETFVEEIALGELAESAVRKKVEYVQDHAQKGEGTEERKIRLRFRVSPVEIVGEEGRVTAIRIERNELVADGKGGVKAIGTGEIETHPVGLVLRSVGYRGIPIPGVPFDERSGHVPHVDGRVVSAPGQPPLPGLYVVGWAKRGPSGLIGTNKADSAATVQGLLEDLAAGRIPEAEDPSPESIPRLLEERGIRAVSFADWERLDRLEKENGARVGKVREKFTRIEEMLAALDGEQAEEEMPDEGVA